LPPSEALSIITPVILSGGSGTRLWPVSRAARPKQLRPLVGETSLLAQTLERLAAAEDGLFGQAAIITNTAHLPETLRQIAGVDPPPQLILEPVGRNTAACAAIAALWKAASGDREGLVLLAASDHHMPDPAAFRRAAASAVGAARAGYLVTFGIRPTHPETGYGYVRQGPPFEGIFEAAGFVEKPDLDTARRYLADGGYYWNASYFLFRADRMIEEMKRLQPEILRAADASLARAGREGTAITLDPDAFSACPSDSIDYAIMERADRVALAPVDAAWSDLGSWAAIWDASAKDPAGNAVHGPALLLDARDCLVHSDGPMVAVVDGADLIVVVEDGAVLVAHRASAQKVKSIVDALKKAGREDLL
jgi:mannose-1-phosphate guanylyltransferase/mannose-1-phosphate guanylyltransferase/mannose-6-phosphate isomerase